MTAETNSDFKSGEGADNGRSATLDRLARHYGSALGRFFERRVDRKADVPDLVQEVFLRLSRLGDLSEIQKPEHYLFRTAASALKDRARRNIVRHATAHQVFDESAHSGSDFSPHRVLVGREAVAQLCEALRKLPVRTRDVFVLRAFEEQKMADVARSLGISTRAAEKHYAKALVYAARVLGEWDDC